MDKFIRGEDVDLLGSLQCWVERGVLLGVRFDAVDAVMMVAPECPLKVSVWKVFNSYTEVLALVMGDKDGWLDWFAWECDFGRKPRVMRFSDGEELLVVSADDLLKAIKGS